MAAEQQPHDELSALGYVCGQCGWEGDEPAIAGFDDAPERTSPLLAEGQAVCPKCGNAFRGVILKGSPAWDRRSLGRQRNPTYPTATV